MGRLKLTWLGTPGVLHAGRPVALATRKTLALLIYLSATEGLHSREKLAALLWPESDDASGRASLRRSIAFLRQALAESMIDKSHASAAHLLVERDAIGFNFASDVALDLRDLESAAHAARQNSTSSPVAAAQLYRGDFLEGFSLKDAPEFDDWAGAQREYWHRQAANLFDVLSQLQSEAGELSAALETAARWATHDPVDDRANARLMELHLAHGDRAAALQTYDAHRASLAEQLHAEPAPEVQALAERLRSGQRSILTPRSMSGSLPPAALETPFVGRAVEFRELVAAYHRSRAGRLQVVILAGEAGIGKTRLVTEFMSWAVAQGADALKGRAFETGGALPYQLIVEALRSGLADPAVLRGRLTDTWLAELARLLPELRDAFPDLLVRPAEETAQAQLFEAVARLGETLALRSPLVLFLDDIQWADAASLDLLHYVGRRWLESGVPVLILACLRIEAVRGLPAIETWLTSADRDLPVRRLSLKPLTSQDTLLIVAALGAATQKNAGPEESPALITFNRWLFGETGGQPLFIVETFNSLLDHGALVPEPMPDGGWRIDFGIAARAVIDLRGLLPPGMREVIRQRLKRLPAGAVAVLDAAAVLGRQASFERLRQVSGLNEDEALSALETLLAGHLLHEAGSHGAYAFTHDKIRDVAYAEAGLARMQVYHRRTLDLLEAGHAAAAELAHHALLAGLSEPAFRYSVAAGDEALKLFAAPDATAHYERALSLVEDGDALFMTPGDAHHLYAQLGRAYDLGGELVKAQQAYKSLLAQARQVGDASIERLALNRLATLIAQVGGDFALAKELLQQALGVAETAHDLAGLAETEWNMAQMGFYTWDEAHVLEHAQRALRLAQETGGRDLIARSHNVLGLANWVLGRFEESEHHSLVAQQLYAELGNRVMEADSQCVLAEAQIRLGKAPAAIDTARLAYATGRELQNAWGQIGAACRLALALKETGQLESAQAVADDAVAVSRAVAAPHWLVIALCLRGAIYRDLQDLERALAVHLEAQSVADGPVSPIFKALPRAHLCADYAALGDWDQAYRWVPPPPSWGELTLDQGLLRWYAIETLVRQGQLERARSDARAFEAQIGDNQRYRISYLRCQAVLAVAAGQNAAASTHLREAAALAQQIGLPVEEVQALAALAGLSHSPGGPQN